MSADNTVRIPDAIVRLLDLKPGAELEWQAAPDGSLILRKRNGRAEMAGKLVGIARPFLKPGDDPVANLVAERLRDDSEEYAEGHAAHIPARLLRQEILPGRTS